jgi:hypothetical protein
MFSFPHLVLIAMVLIFLGEEDGLANPTEFEFIPVDPRGTYSTVVFWRGA